MTPKMPFLISAAFFYLCVALTNTVPFNTQHSARDGSLFFVMCLLGVGVCVGVRFWFSLLAMAVGAASTTLYSVAASAVYLFHSACFCGDEVWNKAQQQYA